MLPYDTQNLAQGASTFGITEYVVWLDDLAYNGWMAAANDGGLGLCYGLMAVTFATRMFFVPIAMYG